MWNSIVNDLRKLKTLQTRAAEVSKQQVDLEARISKCKRLDWFARFYVPSCLNNVPQSAFNVIEFPTLLP